MLDDPQHRRRLDPLHTLQRAALGVAAFGTLLAARMEHSLRDSGVPDPHGAARALAGGGAAVLRGRLSGVPGAEHALRAAFASGLDAAAVTAGALGLVAGVVVLLLGADAAAGGGAGGGAAAGGGG